MTADTFQLTLARVHPESPDAVSLEFDLPAGITRLFSYRAGQYLTVELPWEDFTIRRCYSLSSAEGVDARPRVTVKRVAGGRASNWLCDHAAPGVTLAVLPPEGRFVLDGEAPDDRPLILLGAGSGVTPILSLLKEALTTTGRPIWFLDAHRDTEHALFRDEIDALVAGHPDRVTLHHHLDAEADGHLTEATLTALLPDGLADVDAYVCGPTPFMDLGEAALSASGVPLARQRFERFVSPVDPDRQPAPAPEPEVPANAEATPLRVTWRGEEHALTCPPGKTLLESARDQGLDLPSSCEQGICGACMAVLTAGEVALDADLALTDADHRAGRTLLCQARPVGTDPIAVDLDDPGPGVPLASGGASGDGPPLGLIAGGLLVAVALAAAAWLGLF